MCEETRLARVQERHGEGDLRVEFGEKGRLGLCGLLGHAVWLLCGGRVVLLWRGRGLGHGRVGAVVVLLDGALLLLLVVVSICPLLQVLSRTTMLI